ncbi:MAG: two pore domain potassium channel family protein [Proteobacteria bacterium]|nr:two pore domain potassium channel family protein [Pseudomonadota bacterium]MBI3499749.1 two pore domain potassium channel family protein [Pseudomonadota bacterium]
MPQSNSEGLARWRLKAQDPILTVLAIVFALESFLNPALQAASPAVADLFSNILVLLVVAAVFVLPLGFIAVGAVLAAFVVSAGLSLGLVHPSPAVAAHLHAASYFVFMGVLIFLVGKAVFASGRITYHRVLGAVVLYLAIGTIFVGAYELVTSLDPGAFAGIPPESDPRAVGASLTYFSYVTLTSTGFGDIAPVHPAARSLVNLEAVIGQVFPATIFARIVTLQLAPGPGQDRS